MHSLQFAFSGKVTDKDAFLFNISQQLRFDCKDPQSAHYMQQEKMPIFGTFDCKELAFKDCNM